MALAEVPTGASVAALALQGNPVALFELQIFSDVFLQYQISATVPELMGAVQSLYPQTGMLGLSAIDAGSTLAQNILNNKPTI